MSGTAYDQVKNKIALEFDYVGEKSVKNIAEPVRVYRVRSPTGVSRVQRRRLFQHSAYRAKRDWLWQQPWL